MLSYQVTLKNRNISLIVNSDQTIYEAALKAGVQLPIGCNYGGCITCAAKLVAGKVRQPGASALNRRQSKAGFILLCVAKPKTDCIVEEGVESHEGLFQNPFTSTGFTR
ncbi:MAG: 2Fe-2S iron-sulfur cluster binding domain-containing protein [Rhodobacteraceae bacterium]|nr:2Fe-2S iron-sulfur cluster binding domain-containing protein [Paracoccaceae bacterium]